MSSDPESSAADVIAVAEYVLDLLDECDEQRLMELLYRAQAWTLAMDGRPLFDAPILATPEGVHIQAVHDWLADRASREPQPPDPATAGSFHAQED